MKKKLCLWSLMLLSINQVFAQDEPVVKMFQEYITEVNDLNGSGKIKRVLKFFTDGAKIHNTVVYFDGNTSSSNQDLKGFEAGLQGLISDDQLKTNITIDQYTNVQQTESKGMLTALITMNLTWGGQSIEKSSYLVNIIGEKKEGEKRWRISYMSNTRNILERTAGECICYLYERENRFATEVIYPIGMQFEKKMDVFVLSDLGKDKMLEVRGERFLWKPGGRVTGVSAKASAPGLGVARTEQEAILLILKRIYFNTCFNFALK